MTTRSVRSTVRLSVSVFTFAVLVGAGSTGPASGADRKFKNCTTMNNVYPHGVGLPGAVDRVPFGEKPVTNFKRDASLYRAQSKNLDRDGDGIACEN